jgi:hypothetical protein
MVEDQTHPGVTEVVTNFTRARGPVACEVVSRAVCSALTKRV